MKLPSYQSFSGVDSSSLGTPEFREGGRFSICKRFFSREFKDELKILLTIAWPIIITNLLLFLILSESIMICGHLTRIELDGVSLANSMINALGISLGIGLCSACDTLFSQAYGSSDKRRVGTYLLQSIMIIGSFPLLAWPIHINIEPIFLALGQIPLVSKVAAEYMLWFTPGLVFNFLFLIQARYLQNQDKVVPPMLCAMAGNVFNVISQFVCIHALGYGIRASAVCQALTFVIMCLLIFLYIKISKVYKETWNGWDTESLLNWWQFLKLAIPGMGMVTMETFCWEIETFVAGFMGEEALGAQSILFQAETWTFQIALGLSIAVNIRVGQNLGAMNGSRAKLAWKVGVFCLLCSATCTAILFASCKDLLPAIFTDDENIKAIAAGVFPLLGVIQYIDGTSCVSAGALRGCGRQALGSVFVFVAYYALGLPIGIPVALSGVGVLGLWLGLLVGICITTPSYIFVLGRQDWNLQAELAQGRIRTAQVKQLMYDTDAEDFKEPEDEIKETVALLTDSKELSHRHRRISSNPAYTSSTKYVPLRRGTISEHSQIKKIALQRLFTILAGVLILVVSIILRQTTWTRNRVSPEMDNVTFPVTSASEAPTNDLESLLLQGL